MDRLTQFELYEWMLYFAVYSILGWIFYRCAFTLRKKQRRYGICRGPYLVSCGIGALLVILLAEPADQFVRTYLREGLDPRVPVYFLCGIAVGLICAVLSAVCARIFSGKNLVHWNYLDIVLWGAGGLILMWHLHPLIVVISRWINPWANLIFLLLFYGKMLSDYIDGVAGLMRYRKKGTISENHE